MNFPESWFVLLKLSNPVSENTTGSDTGFGLIATPKGVPFVARDSSGLFFSFKRVVITCSWTFVGKVFTKPATFSAASDKAHLCEIPCPYDCLQVLQRTETVLTWSF